MDPAEFLDMFDFQMILVTSLTQQRSKQITKQDLCQYKHFYHYWFAQMLK